MARAFEPGAAGIQNSATRVRCLHALVIRRRWASDSRSKANAESRPSPRREKCPRFLGRLPGDAAITCPLAAQSVETERGKQQKTLAVLRLAFMIRLERSSRRSQVLTSPRGTLVRSRPLEVRARSDVVRHRRPPSRRRLPRSRVARSRFVPQRWTKCSIPNQSRGSLSVRAALS